MAFADHMHAYLDAVSPDLIAGLSLVVGALLVARGFAFAKFIVITVVSTSLGFTAYMQVMALASVTLLAMLAFTGALVVSLLVSHFVYPMLVFIIGCILGGFGIFKALLATSLIADPTSLLGITIISSVVVGLSFRRFRDAYWRVISPPIGGFLMAAAVRFCFAKAEDGIMTQYWTSFVHDLDGGFHSNACGIAFICTWGVATFTGWYLQLGMFFGDEDHFALSDVALARLDEFHGVCPWFFDNYDKTSWTLPVYGNTPLSQSFVERTRDKTKADYRPEGALVLTVASVVVLNISLLAQPVLFVGHAVLMSVAFLPLLSAGLMSYASPNLVLANFFGAGSGTALQRHFAHGMLNGSASLCAVAGYLCIYKAHSKTGASQLGLDTGNAWSRVLHVWIGYFVLGLLLLQSLSGVVKLAARYIGRHALRFHSSLGRVIYGLAATNQLIAYYLGLLPMWQAFLLSSMLLVAVMVTFFYLNASQQPRKAPVETNAIDSAWGNGTIVAKSLSCVGERLQNLKAATKNVSQRSSNSKDSTATDMSEPCLTPESRDKPGTPNRKKNFTSLELILAKLDGNDKIAMLHTHFSAWHRLVQACQLTRTAEELEGAERLTLFISGQLIDDVYKDNVNTGVVDVPEPMTSSSSAGQRRSVASN
mmetsp:Transcript_108538/g.305934  ORF Transcript_108538/g.305934 Transcript_108538/m.305934 type:complete len:650 (-) Transcript_108538:317-2266(-)|eukprot:CAMPEP_0117525504 /NCGR_PEP_ID=MMETSP0784-20121206/35802_1 /TAXON_ID=39447 /ORGANISM="" /LENGTH=649 /DNA_ID=CAMNT_0005321699 /DNA_START=52 /DNA_END=2001 /DNA_ORIENTATION=-